MHFQDKLFGLVELEALGQRSLPRNLMLTRRGRRALDSGVPERWMDVPLDPA